MPIMCPCSWLSLLSSRLFYDTVISPSLFFTPLFSHTNSLQLQTNDRQDKRYPTHNSYVPTTLVSNHPPHELHKLSHHHKPPMRQPRQHKRTNQHHRNKKPHLTIRIFVKPFPKLMPRAPLKQHLTALWTPVLPTTHFRPHAQPFVQTIFPQYVAAESDANGNFDGGVEAKVAVADWAVFVFEVRELFFGEECAAVCEEGRAVWEYLGIWVGGHGAGSSSCCAVFGFLWRSRVVVGFWHQAEADDPSGAKTSRLKSAVLMYWCPDSWRNASEL